MFCILTNENVSFSFIFLISSSKAIIIVTKEISKFYNNNKVFVENIRKINEKETFSFVKILNKFIDIFSSSNYPIYLFIIGVEEILIAIFF